MSALFENELLARRYLLAIDSIRATLFDLASGKRVDDNSKSDLNLFSRMVRDLGLPEQEATFVASLAAEVAKGKTASSEDLAHIAAALDSCHFALNSMIPAQTGDSQPVEPHVREVVDRALAFVDLSIGQDEQGALIPRIGEVERLIRSRPGLFINQVFETLNRPGRRHGFSYSSVWTSVQTLVNQKRVLTVGGPSGVERYCFPHPNSLRNWSPFYGKAFPIEARLERNVTRQFDFSKLTRFVDVFEANSVMRRPVYLIAEMGRLEGIQGKLIRSLGTLLPFSQLGSSLGLAAHKSTKKLDLLRAGYVDLVLESNWERRVWKDPEFAGPVVTSPP